jgi:hypothetical protein
LRRRTARQPPRGLVTEPPSPQEPPSIDADLRGLASDVGNRAFGGLVDGRGRAAGLLLRQDRNAEARAREAFRARGPMPGPDGLDFQSTTALGGFNVRYDPASQELLVRLRVGIDYRDALAIDPATGAVTPASADFATHATNVTNRFPDVGPRVTAVRDNWQWQADAKVEWGQRYAAAAAAAWGGRHHFTTRRWPDVFADVRVELDVHDGHRANDHCKATVYRVPEGTTDPGGVVHHAASATGARGTFTSAHLDPRADDLLNHRLEYPPARAAVTDAKVTSALRAGSSGPDHLDTLIAHFQRARGRPGAPIAITGHASRTGDPQRNRELSRRRAQNVAAYLRTHGDRIAADRIGVDWKGDDEATEEPTWQRVDIRVGTGSTQAVMIHETGHMFGLSDEYVVAGFFTSGTGGTPGQPVAHGPLAGAMGGGVQAAVYENNDNIMSAGNVVRPQHYATFLEALNRVAAPEAFEYGGGGASPARGIPDLMQPGAPAPATAVA